MVARFTCPCCGSPLKALTVLCSGPLGPKRCRACNGQYFGGGGARSLSWFFGGWVLTFALGPLMPYPRVMAPLFVVVGFALFVWQALRSKAEPIEHRSTDLWQSALVTLVAGALIYASVSVHT